MFNFKDKISGKKGSSELWWIIAVAVIAFTVVILILLWFRNSGGTSFRVIDQQLEQLKDTDGDKVYDMFEGKYADGSSCNGGKDEQKDQSVDSKGCLITKITQ